MKRDGVSREYAGLRVNAQPDDEFYRKNCNRVLRNTGTKTEFKKQCEALFMEVLQ
jgi:dephospho-CoA kinase